MTFSLSGCDARFDQSGALAVANALVSGCLEEAPHTPRLPSGMQASLVPHG